MTYYLYIIYYYWLSYVWGLRKAILYIIYYDWLAAHVVSQALLISLLLNLNTENKKTLAPKLPQNHVDPISANVYRECKTFVILCKEL